jgi:hypothetical protein
MVARRTAMHDDERARALSIILVEGAMGETISSALFNAGRHATTEPCSRAALSHIARDEARHARRFWESLWALEPELDERDHEGLVESARMALGELEKGVVPALRRLEAGEPFDPALGQLGLLDPERRVEAFYHSLETAVRPRLRRLGIDDDKAWRERYRKDEK